MLRSRTFPATLMRFDDCFAHTYLLRFGVAVDDSTPSISDTQKIQRFGCMFLWNSVNNISQPKIPGWDSRMSSHSSVIVPDVRSMVLDVDKAPQPEITVFHCIVF